MPFFVSFFINDNNLFAQVDSCVLLDIQTKTGEKGEEICLQVKVSNFKNISYFQFPLNYDPTVILPLRVQNLASLIGFDPSLINIDNNKKVVRVTWSNPNSDGLDLPDNTILFEICFKLIGPPGSCTRLYFSDKPIITEFGTPDKTVCVKDLNDQDQIKIQIPTGLCVLASTCGSQNGTGNITIKAWGGTAPYDINLNTVPPVNASINTNGGSHTFNNLPNGNYKLKITDATGKDSIINLVIPASTAITINNVIGNPTKPPTCWNTSDGRININVFGGVGELLIGWKPLNIYGVTSVSGLPVGKYTVCVTDSLGCTSSREFEFVQSEIIGTVEIEKDATCKGNDGIVLAKATGGNPNPNAGMSYKFFWSQNVPANCTTSVDSTCRNTMMSGKQFVLIEDSRGCQDTVFFVLPTSGSLRDSVLVDSVDCFGGNNGVIKAYAISSIGLSLPISFNLFSIPLNTPIAGGVTNGAEFTSPGLKAGTYKLDLMDGNGCIYSDTIDVYQPFILELLENSIDTIESCTPGMDASLDLRATGGTGPYTYTWNPNIGNTPNLSNLTAGTYTLTARDFHNCTVSKSYRVIKPNAPKITGFEKQEISCSNMNDGCVEVKFTVGTSAIRTIQWNTGPNTQKICNLGAGNYIVTITDQNGCSAVDSVRLTSIAGSMVLDSFTQRDPSCPGLSDGLILVFIKGGIPPYKFTWNGLVGSPVITGLKAGTYDLEVSDSSNCPPIKRRFTLIDPPGITSNLQIIKQPSCIGTNNCDGQAILNISGIHPDYSILWSSREQVFTNIDTATMLCGGSQFAIITNGTCIDTVFFDLPNPTPISLSQTLITHPSCYQSKDGAIVIVAQGGKPNYSYTWDNAASGPTNTGLGDGLYRVLISDANNCVYRDSFRVRQPDSVRVDVITGSTIDVSCYGKNDGRIVTAWGGGNRGPGSFSWIPNISSDSLANNLGPGKYTLIVTDRNGCTGLTSHVVNEPPPLIRTYSPIDTPNCSGDQVDFSVLTAIGGAGPDYRFTINNGAPNNIGDYEPLFPGTYMIRIFDRIGCYVDTSIIVPAPLNDLSINFLKAEETIQLGDSIRLEGLLNSRSPLDTVLWTPMTSVRNPRDIVSFVTPPKTTMYTLTVIDDNGCTASDKITIIVENNRRFYVPNVMSANDDGLNDNLELITGTGVAKVDFVQVYDRWGAKVYEVENPDISSGRVNTWDGRFDGKLCNPGVYVYIAQVKYIDGATFVYRGDITLLR